MRLGADAVVLIFYRCIRKIAESFLGRFDGAGEHEVDGMKEPQTGLVESVSGGEAQGFANVAQQHVGALDPVERSFECAGDRLFDETFFQADAQISGDDLDDVLGFERRGLFEKMAQERGFGGGSTSGGDGGEGLLYFVEGKISGRSSAVET